MSVSVSYRNMDSTSLEGEVDTLLRRSSLLARLAGLARHKGLHTLVDQGTVSVTGFATSVLIGRFCDKDQLGVYMLALSIALLITELQSSLISTPYMIHSPRLGEEEQKVYRGSVLVHQLVLCIVAVLSIVCWGIFRALGEDEIGLAPMLMVLAAVIGFLMIRDFVRRLCFAQLQMTTAVIFDGAIAIFQLGGLAFFAFSGTLSTNVALAVMGGACAISSIGWFLVRRDDFVPRIGLASSHLKQNWGLGKWILASGALWTVSMNLYPWFITLFHGTESTGVWGACLGILGLVNAVMLGLQNYIGPKIATTYAIHGMEALRVFAKKASLILVATLGSFACLFALLGDRLLTLVYGDQYAGNGLALALLSLGFVAASIGFVYSRALFALEKSDVDFRVNFVPLAVLGTFGLWMVRWYGPLGAAWGLLVAHMLSAAVRGFLVHKICRHHSAQ